MCRWEFLYRVCLPHVAVGLFAGSKAASGLCWFGGETACLRTFMNRVMTAVLQKIVVRGQCP